MDILHEHAKYQGENPFHDDYPKEDHDRLQKEIVAILCDRSNYPILSVIAASIALVTAKEWWHFAEDLPISRYMSLVASIKQYLVLYVIGRKHDHTTVESHAAILLFGCACVLRPDILSK